MQVKTHGIEARQAHFDLPRIKEFLGDTWAGGYLHRREDNAYEVVGKLAATANIPIEILVVESVDDLSVFAG